MLKIGKSIKIGVILGAIAALVGKAANFFY